MKRSLKIFYLYALLSYKTIFQTKLGVVFLIMGKVFRFLFLFSLIYLIFSKTKLVKGYTLDQMIIFYLTFNIIDSTVQILYKEPIQGIFTFVIPVGIMMSFPAKALLGLLNPATYLFSFFFSILFLLISLKLWKSALTKYQSWGG